MNDFMLFDPQTGAAFPGLNFAISSDTVKRVVPSLILQGSYSHPWLGIKIIDVNPFIADFRFGRYNRHLHNNGTSR